jgi:hypothetical protein
MARESSSGGTARHPRARQDVTLKPPPRAVVPPFEGATPSAAHKGAARSGVAPTAALLAVLAVLVAGVFVLLPRWVASRSAATAAVPPSSDRSAPPASLAAAQPAPAAPAATLAPSVEDESFPPARSGAPPAVTRSEEMAPAAPEPPQEWARAMSEGLAALDRGQFAEAQGAFARAESARPGTRVVADARQRAEEGLKAETLSRYRARGQGAEAGEDWKGALVEYEAALKLEPQVAFALEGRARSLPRAQLDALLAAYLQRPDRLSAEPVRREAEDALERARDAASTGPRLQQQTAALERLLQEARTPLDVRLVSDGLTEVAVQRVGTLGAFKEKSVALRPGSYVVTGKRKGYRDTRKTLVVSPTHIPPPLDVRCDQTL